MLEGFGAREYTCIFLYVYVVLGLRENVLCCGYPQGHHQVGDGGGGGFEHGEEDGEGFALGAPHEGGVDAGFGDPAGFVVFLVEGR